MTTTNPSPEHVAGGAARRALSRALGTVGRRCRRAPFVFGAVAALVVGLSAGSAYAWFTSSGSGSATASVGTVQTVTVLAATGTPTSKLHPGASADLTLTISNPNASPVTLVSVTQHGTVTVVGGTGCTPSNSGVTVPTQSGLSISVASGTSVVVHIPNGASMSTSSANGCQGASFHIPVLITAEKR